MVLKACGVIATSESDKDDFRGMIAELARIGIKKALLDPLMYSKAPNLLTAFLVSASKYGTGATNHRQSMLSPVFATEKGTPRRMPSHFSVFQAVIIRGGLAIHSPPARLERIQNCPESPVAMLTAPSKH